MNRDIPLLIAGRATNFVFTSLAVLQIANSFTKATQSTQPARMSRAPHDCSRVGGHHRRSTVDSQLCRQLVRQHLFVVKVISVVMLVVVVADGTTPASLTLQMHFAIVFVFNIHISVIERICELTTLCGYERPRMSHCSHLTINTRCVCVLNAYVVVASMVFVCFNELM